MTPLDSLAAIRAAVVAWPPIMVSGSPCLDLADVLAILDAARIPGPQPAGDAAATREACAVAVEMTPTYGDAAGTRMRAAATIRALPLPEAPAATTHPGALTPEERARMRERAEACGPHCADVPRLLAALDAAERRQRPLEAWAAGWQTRGEDAEAALSIAEADLTAARATLDEIATRIAAYLDAHKPHV